MRRSLQRLGLILGGLLAPLMVVEIGLQAASGWFRREQSPATMGKGDTVVLCLGDSHTYGVYQPPSRSYPQRLQAHLEATLGEGTFTVIRAGWPGLGTATLRRQLPALLTRYGPDWVVILGGLNNRWNRSDREAGGPGWAERLLGWSRLWKMVRVYVGQRYAPQDAPAIVSEPPEHREFDHALQNLPDPEIVAEVRADVIAMSQTCRAAGARPIVLTYAAAEPEFEAANQGLREAAAAGPVPLVDLARTFAALLRQRPYEELLIPGDFHPQPRGYDLMAQQVAQALLKAAGHEISLVVAAVTSDREPGIELRSEPGAPRRLLVRGPAGASFRVFLSLQRDPPLRLPRATLPLCATDGLFLATQDLPGLGGQLDASGASVLDLSALTGAGPLPDATAYAAAVLYARPPTNPKDRPAVVAASGAVIIQR